jgi:hypothetical protein
MSAADAIFPILAGLSTNTRWEADLDRLRAPQFGPIPKGYFELGGARKVRALTVNTCVYREPHPY